MKCAVCGEPRKHEELYIVRDKYICDTCGLEEKSEREISLQELIWQFEYKGHCILPKIEEECDECERECVVKMLLEKVVALEDRIAKLEKKQMITNAKDV